MAKLGNRVFYSCTRFGGDGRQPIVEGVAGPWLVSSACSSRRDFAPPPPDPGVAEAHGWLPVAPAAC